MPVGVQILGPLYGDLTTIDLARRIGKEVGGFVAPPGYESHDMSERARGV